MSKLFSKTTIKVVDNYGCSEAEVEVLSYAFTYTIKHFYLHDKADSYGHACKAWFRLTTMQEQDNDE